MRRLKRGAGGHEPPGPATGTCHRSHPRSSKRPTDRSRRRRHSTSSSLPWCSTTCRLCRAAGNRQADGICTRRESQPKAETAERTGLFSCTYFRERRAQRRQLCRGGHRPKVQVRKLFSGALIDALYAVNAGDSTNVGEDAFKLAPVDDLEAGLDAGILAVRAAFQITNVGTGAADDGGDLSQQTRAILGANRELDREGGRALAAPLDRNAAFRLVEKILHIGAGAGVYGNSAAAGDVSDDLIARDGVAAFGAEDQQVVVALDDQGSFPDAQHAFDGFDQGGLGVVAGFVGLDAFAEHFRQHLPRGVLPEAHGGKEILHLGQAVIGRGFLQFGFFDLFERASESARFLFEQAAAHFGGLFALAHVDPMANLAFGARRFDKAQPVATRAVALLRQNLHHIATRNLMAQGHHLAVDFRADTLVPDFGVNGVCEVHRSGPGGKLQNPAFGSEGVDFVRGKVDFEGGEKFTRLLQFLGPLDQLPHPGDALVVVAGGLAVFVFPVGGDPFLRDAVHFLGADLDFKGLPGVDYRGVQGLIKVRPRHGDVILEPAGHGTPDVMDYAQGRVTVAFVVGDDANGQQVINLLEAALLALDLAVQRIQALYPGF